MLKQVFLGILLCTLLINLSAQYQRNWADGILDSLANDQSKTHKLTKKYGDTLLQIFESRKDNCSWIKTKCFISAYHTHFGDYKTALSGLKEAFARYKPNLCQGTPILPQIYLSFATLYFHLDEYKKEDEYIEKGIKSWQSGYTDKTILIMLYDLKACLFKDLDQMMFYYQKGYKIALESNNLKMQEQLLLEIGASYAEAGEIMQADTFLRKALRLALKRQSYRNLTSIYNSYAGMADDLKMSAYYLDSSIYFANLSGNLEDLQIGMQNRAFLYYLNRQYKNGYDELWKSKEIGDSLYNFNKINAFADMEQKYEAEKKNHQIKQLESEKDIANLKASRNLAVDIGVGTTLLGIILLAATFYSQKKKKQKLNIQLSVEKKKSDDLLLNILPEEVADELKLNGQSEAKLYNNVTVLFTDFVNFTGISQNLTPIELVGEIHKNFLGFDAIIGKNGLEKIKTIGDAYMAVCGLPSESPDHAQRAVRAALEIRQFLKEGNSKFEVRIGIHSGSVVAGIVGVKKYAYDIWGDTVNTANRMESNSEPGKINISESTYELVKDEFTFTYRGKHEVKGKGAMDMYFVEGLVV